MASPYYNASAANGPTGGHTYDHRHPTHGVGALESELPPHQEGDGAGGTWTKGEVQPRRCNDVLFAGLFVGHLVAMAVVAGVYAPMAMQSVVEQAGNAAGDAMSGEDDGGQRDLLAGGEEDVGSRSGLASRMTRAAVRLVVSSTVRGRRHLQEDGGDVSGVNDFNDLLLLMSISAAVALVISTTLALSVMISHAQALIKTALCFNIAASAVFAIASLFVSPFAAIWGIMLLGFTAYYAYVVWGRIPFAAANLTTATTAVRKNLGLAYFAYGNLFVVVGWSAWWMVTFVSTIYVTSECNAEGCAKEENGLLVFLLLLSYYWTYQVLKNIVHVTVSGTVGTWWFVPSEASSCCSHAVRDSYVRCVTTSFGSICFGSLLVAIIQAVKQMVRNLRESEDGGGILLCLAECLLACLADIMEYFNQWAFVFVGLYGYDFLTAGKNVINLFKTRGWTTIITDNLAQGVLGMVSAAVGLLTGLISLVIASSRGMVFGDELGASAASFFVGFVTGMVLTNTLLTLVSSAVNTVVVCYAEAPAEFQTNHPALSDEMRGAWRQAWPVDFKY
mmetsp:Transcript_28842/g.64639  ORF Transcript_28842/g.64639 Transcript_28842/m.64639 type:complete len:560 (+) Transcript_28842:126-1805(+)